MRRVTRGMRPIDPAPRRSTRQMERDDASAAPYRRRFGLAASLRRWARPARKHDATSHPGNSPACVFFARLRRLQIENVMARRQQRGAGVDGGRRGQLFFGRIGICRGRGGNDLGAPLRQS